MSEPYPFKPKSNVKLKPGQFWAIKLLNGTYGCGIVLDVPPKTASTTKTFFAGLLDWVGTSKPTKAKLVASKLKLIAQGKAHIKTITADGEQIDGEIDLEKCALNILPELDSAMYSDYSQILRGFDAIGKAAQSDHENLNTQSTWGFNVINKKANRLLLRTNCY